MLSFPAFLFATSGQLALWLEQRSGNLKTQIEFNSEGLRGLKRDIRNNVACSIPRKCAILADPSDIGSNYFERPIDLLSCSLLAHLRRGHSSYFAPYLETLPQASDITLSTPGSRWSDQQLERLRHSQTISRFKRLRHHRKNFINVISSIDNEENIDELAGWAYDLASSRALEGHFGKNGSLRFALSCFLVATIFALLPLMSMIGPLDEVSNNVILPVENTIPLFPSFAFLVHILSKKNNEIAMIPWIDVANHNSAATMSFEYDLLKDSIVFKEARTKNILVLDDKWITFDYGGINNDRLLGEYGFVEIDNPNDTFDLKINECRTITLGRRGIIIDHSNETNEMIVNAAYEMRKNLGEPLDEIVCSDDPFDIEIAAAAQLWRQEKIRILDEYLERALTSSYAHPTNNDALVSSS